MPVIMVITRIDAPMQRCFDLARDIDLHMRSLQISREKAVAGVTSGLIGLGEEVTWEATHFGIRQRLTSRITALDPPRYFRDSQVRGAFHSFDHDHVFEAEGEVTVMRDVFAYESPLGILGRIADVLFLESYMKRLIERRAAAIKLEAEMAC